MTTIQQGYYSKHRVKITLADGAMPAEADHDDKGDGTALCGIPLRPLGAHPAQFTPIGPGIVTCGNCWRVNEAS